MLTITYGYTGSASLTINLADTALASQQTKAIQSALNAVAGHAGGTVTLSAGVFSIIGSGDPANGALRIGSDTTLQGSGMGKTVIKLADGVSGVTGLLRTASGGVLPDGSLTTTSNVMVKGLSLDGNMAKTVGATDGFYCGPEPGSSQHDSNITLDGVEIMNMSRYGFDPHEQTVGITIANSVAHHNGVDGFVLDYCSNVQLINDAAYANGRHGINVVTGSSNVAIINANLHDNGGSGVVVQTGDNEIRGFTNNVTISGGTVANNGKIGIDIHQATDIAIDHVAISGNGTHGILLAGVERAALASNAISGVPAGSKAVQIAGYVQDFADTEAVNDRYIGTHGVTIDGVAQPDPLPPAGVTPWSYHVSAGDDAIIGTTVKDAIAAGSGNDTVSGGLGNDVLNGEDGRDVLYGDDGNDTMNGGAGDDKLYGGAGNDKLVYSSGYDVLDGGSGFDTVEFTKFGSGVYINMNLAGTDVWTSGTWTSNAANSTIAVADIANAEYVRATSHSDTVVGNAAANWIDGGGGNDTISGGAGADVIFGGSGADFIVAGTGNDTVTGGTGNDVLRYISGWGSDTVKDFAVGQDRLDFIGVTGLTSFANLTITATAAGADVSFGADHILLQGVAASSLTAADFLFH